MSDDLKAKLVALKELHDLGLVTDADYQHQKDALLGTFAGSTSASQVSAAGASLPARLSGTTRVVEPPPAGLSGQTTVGGTDVSTQASSILGGTTTDEPNASSGRPERGGPQSGPSADLPTHLGNYAVLGVVGAGGMGTVVRARHAEEDWAQQQGGDVVIKLIQPQIASNPEFRKRFFAEAALGKRIQHPGLATVYDVISDGPWLGTILELIEGKELSEWVRPGGIPIQELVDLLGPLAEALDHIHAQGVVHRDLKPANVKVRPNGRPVLLDLGIAKDLSAGKSGQTSTMTAMGTSAWMAPEQADAKSVTGAADIYALGMIAYVLLSGSMPWPDGVSEVRVLTNKMTGQLRPLRDAKPGLADHVYATVDAALSLDIEQRPSSAGALVEGLSRSPKAAAPEPQVKSSPPEAAPPDPQVDASPPVVAPPQPRPQRTRETSATVQGGVSPSSPPSGTEPSTALASLSRRPMVEQPAAVDSILGESSNEPPTQTSTSAIGATTKLGLLALLLLGLMYVAFGVDNDGPGEGTTPAQKTTHREDVVQATPSPFEQTIQAVKDGRRVSTDWLRELSCDDLWVARNWIYARHGYAFSTNKAQRYYGNESDYSRTNEVTKHTIGRYLTPQDNKNAELVQDAERRKGCSK